MDMSAEEKELLRDNYIPEETNLFRQPNALFTSSKSDDAAPQKPLSVEDTGLPVTMLMDLLVKHLLERQIATMESLCDALKLPGMLVRTLLGEAKENMWVENRSATTQSRFSLSGTGRLQAEKALQQSGYIGPAPVSLSQYKDSVLTQSHRHFAITSAFIASKLEGESFEEEAIATMGMALNSKKPVLLYGLPGTGKSYLCRQLIRIFDDVIYQPYAVAVNNQIIQLFDPLVHQKAERENQPNLDLRFQPVKRPLLVTGGELTLDMLEVNFDPQHNIYRAPLQMKANNGVLLLDDLGRQQVPPAALFNRWIIPLEEQKDYLSLGSGSHFDIPFELVMLFSTNLNPAKLVDDAFLRRLGYKIQMHPLTQESYSRLWQRICQSLDLHCEEKVFNYLLDTYHRPQQKPYLPCLPRDLLGIVKDATRFHSLPPIVTPDLLDDAWRHYFVSVT